MNGEFGALEKFSDEIIRLGKEINDKLRDKRETEEELSVKEKEVRALQAESFKLRERLIKINLELSRLERRRRELEGS